MVVGDLDFEAVIAAAQAEAEARDEREARALSISVDDLYARRESEAANEAAHARHLAACEQRAERIVTSRWERAAIDSAADRYADSRADGY